MGKPVEAAEYMEMPCQCPLCGDWEDLLDMHHNPEGGRELICRDCHQELLEEVK